MRKVAVWVVALALAVGACGDDDDGSGSRPQSAFPVKTAIIETESDPVMLTVEVADTEERRARGLMGRESLPEDRGMVFVFFEEHRGGFWMKNTEIPLSIAFFDEHGEILKILDMRPCRRDPCPIYDPGVAYWGALEVNRGAFERWGVARGDVIRMT
jgi:uncharacterized protein